MQEVAMLVLCAILPAAVGLLMAGGSRLFDLLCRHVEPLRAWHDRGVRRMEAWQEDEEWTRN